MPKTSLPIRKQELATLVTIVISKEPLTTQVVIPFPNVASLTNFGISKLLLLKDS